MSQPINHDDNTPQPDPYGQQPSPYGQQNPYGQQPPQPPQQSPYGQPQGLPMHPPQGYPDAVPGGVAPGGYVRRSGAVAWGLGFLGYIPIPVVGVLVTVGVMLGVGLSQRKHGGTAAANGVNAANWALTYLLLFIVGAVLFVSAVVTAPAGTRDTVPPLGIVALLYFAAIGIMHLVTIILGLVKAGRADVHRAPAIPFFRA